jgi:hypothetical protein
VLGGEQVLPGRVGTSGSGGEGAWEDEYDANTMYSCM